MAGNGKLPDGFGKGGGSESSSSLEKLLQEAWIKSQIPKVQRRSLSAPVVDVSVEKRASSQPSAELLWGVVSGRAGDADQLAKTYFHKTRAEASSETLERLAQPQLESFSEKTDVPRSNSGCCAVGSRASAPGVSDKSSQDSRSPTFSTSESLLSDMQTPMTDGILDGVDFEGVSSGLDDLAGQTEPLAHFFDDFLTDQNLEAEKSLTQQTSAYHAMAKEIADLLGPNAAVDDSGDSEVIEGEHENYWSNAEFLPIEDIRDVEKSSAYQAMAKEIADLLYPEANVLDAERPEVLNDEDSSIAECFPTEDQTAVKLMEGYTRMLSKHIMDVNGVSSSDDVDYRSWITESDEIHVDLEGVWTAYLDSLSKTSTPNPTFDVNLLLSGQGGGLDLSQSSAVFPPSTTTTELLYRCALAVSQGNARSATDYFAELRSRSSPYGTYMERMGHYFMEALVSKLSGTGGEIYTMITNNHPSASTMLKAYRQYVDYCPYIKLSHFFAMKTTLDAFEGATQVHVIHYGIQYGVEWPSLIQHLSLRPAGPPHFRMTGVDLPYPGDDPCKKINETGRRLTEFAKKWGVPFEFHALAGKWESFTAKDFNLRNDEVLAVLSHKLHHISDESVLGASPRELLLRRIRSLNPKVFFVFVENAACNAPLFMTRFRESVKLYTAIFNGLELSMPPDDPERVILEREIHGREILNIVACEGQTRVERQEPYRQWQSRMLRAGFQQVQPKEIIYSKIKAMMNTFHKDYGVGRDEGWFLMGIKNQIVKTCSCWEPKPVLGLIA